MARRMKSLGMGSRRDNMGFGHKFVNHRDHRTHRNGQPFDRNGKPKRLSRLQRRLRREAVDKLRLAAQEDVV